MYFFQLHHFGGCCRNVKNARMTFKLFLSVSKKDERYPYKEMVRGCGYSKIDTTPLLKRDVHSLNSRWTFRDLEKSSPFTQMSKRVINFVEDY